MALLSKTANISSGTVFIWLPREELFNRVREIRPNGAIGLVGHGDLVGSVVSLKALQTFAAAYVQFAAAQPR